MFYTTMNIRRRLIGDVAVMGRNGQVQSLDFDTLIQRLLFFETYVLRTVRLKELPHFVQAFGLDQTIELFESGLIEIECDSTQIGSAHDDRLARSPGFRFHLIWIRPSDWPEYVDRCFSEIRTDSRLRKPDWVRLENAVRKRIKALDQETMNEVGKSFVHQFSNSPAVLAEAVRVGAARQRTPIVLPTFAIEAQVESEDLTRVETDLGRTRLTQVEIWEILRDGLLTLGTIEHQIGAMKYWEALEGFTRQQNSLFESRLTAIACSVNPDFERAQFFRIAQLTGLPRFDLQNQIFRLDRLVKLREDDDFRAFRDWLASASGMSDEEVQRLLKGIRQRFAGWLRGGSGTWVRFITEQVTGILNVGAGAALSALDTFLLGGVLKESGPAAFIRKYPTLFGSQRTKRKRVLLPG